MVKPSAGEGGAWRLRRGCDASWMRRTSHDSHHMMATGQRVHRYTGPEKGTPQHAQGPGCAAASNASSGAGVCSPRSTCDRVCVAMVASRASSSAHDWPAGSGGVVGREPCAVRGWERQRKPQPQPSRTHAQKSTFWHVAHLKRMPTMGFVLQQLHQMPSCTDGVAIRRLGGEKRQRQIMTI